MYLVSDINNALSDTAHLGPSRHLECSLVWDNGLVLGGQRSAFYSSPFAY